MILYTNRLIPERFDGYTIGFVSLIRPKCKEDVGLHAHEAVHRKQFYRNPLMGLFYFFSAEHRLKYELEAYKAQLRIEPEKTSLFAIYLISNYGLDLTKDQAIQLLKEE